MNFFTVFITKSTDVTSNSSQLDLNRKQEPYTTVCTNLTLIMSNNANFEKKTVVYMGKVAI